MSVADLAALAARLERVEAQLDVARVMGSYFLSVDEGYDLVALEALFLPDAECRTTLAPDVSDIASFLAFQEGAREVVEWAFHLCSQLDFRFDAAAGTASGVWSLLGLHTMRNGEEREPLFYTARYDVDFARADEGWRIARLRTSFHQISRFDRGWVEQPFYLPGALQE